MSSTNLKSIHKNAYMNARECKKQKIDHFNFSYPPPPLSNWNILYFENMA